MKVSVFFFWKQREAIFCCLHFAASQCLAKRNQFVDTFNRNAINFQWILLFFFLYSAFSLQLKSPILNKQDKLSKKFYTFQQWSNFFFVVFLSFPSLSCFENKTLKNVCSFLLFPRSECLCIRHMNFLLSWEKRKSYFWSQFSISTYKNWYFI